MTESTPSPNTSKFISNVNTEFTPSPNTSKFISNVNTEFTPSPNTSKFISNVNTEFTPSPNTSKFISNVNTEFTPSPNTSKFISSDNEGETPTPNTQTSQTDDHSARRRLYSESECDSKSILEHASAGLVLSGIFNTGRSEHMITPREIVLEAPDNVYMGEPNMEDECRVVEYSSMEDINTTSEKLKSVGMGATFGLQLGKVEANVGFNVSNSSRWYEQNDINRSCYSFGVHAFVPIKSAKLVPKHLKISECAVSELKKIEKHCDKKQRKNDQSCHPACKKFFNKYGSHIYTGIVHFGGIYNLRATLKKRNKIISKQDNKRIFREIIGEASSRGLPVSFQVNASKHESQDDNVQDHRNNSNIVFTESVQGGLNCGNYKEWKRSLKGKKLSVIERKIFEKKCLTGIWDIIQNNASDLTKPHELKKFLKRNWKLCYREIANCSR